MREVELEPLLREYWPELDSEAILRILKFYDLLVSENQVQNLTRLVEPSDFIFGHLIDVRELLAARFLEFPVMDLGSGCGVPGMLAALIGNEGKWVLAEAEGRKADFLAYAVEQLGIGDRVEVFRGRAEDFFRTGSVTTVVARAVGPVERIFGWIRNCSTWNKLVLLKGPGWQQEWDKFLAARDRKRLEWKNSREYSVGPENKARIIVELIRNVPRGTLGHASSKF